MLLLVIFLTVLCIVQVSCETITKKMEGLMGNGCLIYFLILVQEYSKLISTETCSLKEICERKFAERTSKEDKRYITASGRKVCYDVKTRDPLRR